MVVPAGDLTVAIGRYAQEKLGFEFVPGTYQALMFVDDKAELVGAALFTNYRQHDVEVTIVTETAMVWRPHCCKALADYVFNQLGCVRCTAITAKSNLKARKILTHGGFELEGRIRRGYDGKQNALIYGLLAENCRFLADDSGD